MTTKKTTMTMMIGITTFLFWLTTFKSFRMIANIERPFMHTFLFFMQCKVHLFQVGFLGRHPVDPDMVLHHGKPVHLGWIHVY